MKMFAILFFCIIASSSAESAEYGKRLGSLKPFQLLKSYEGFVNDFVRTNDAYKMEYHVGDSYRLEERTDSGEVTGTFAFVAPEGNEYEFKYEADSDGFKVEGDALPSQPDYTDDVKAARNAFFEAYEKQAELTKDYEYDSESDSSESVSGEESSEESDESSESSEESYEDEEDTQVSVSQGSRGSSRSRFFYPNSR